MEFMLKKLVCAVLFLCFFMQSYAFAQMDDSWSDILVSASFWEIASPVELQEALKNGANV